MTILKHISGYITYPDEVTSGSDEPIVESDATTTGSIAVDILNNFDIPVRGIRGSSLPGYDIYNQNAVEMIKLSLAAEFKDNHLTEVYIDETGMAYFVDVGETASDLDDIRTVVETTLASNPVDTVMITGYKPAVKRVLRDGIDPMRNKEVIDWIECKGSTCEDKQFSTEASIIFDDPVLSSDFNDDINSLYEIQAFEQLLGFVVDLDMPSKDDYPGMKVTFSNDDCLYPVSVGEGELLINDAPIDAVTYAEEFGCEPPVYSQVYGSKVRLGPFKSSNRFVHGGLDSDFISIESVVFTGHKIIYANDFRAFPGQDPKVFVYCEEKPSLYELQMGKEWLYSVGTANRDRGYVDLLIYHPDFNGMDSAYREAAFYILGGATQLAGGVGVAGINDGMGYYIKDICAVVRRRKGSVHVVDEGGKAKEIANKIKITYYPIENDNGDSTLFAKNCVFYD